MPPGAERVAEAAAHGDRVCSPPTNKRGRAAAKRRLPEAEAEAATAKEVPAAAAAAGHNATGAATGVMATPTVHKAAQVSVAATAREATVALLAMQTTAVASVVATAAAAAAAAPDVLLRANVATSQMPMTTLIACAVGDFLSDIAAQQDTYQTHLDIEESKAHLLAEVRSEGWLQLTPAATHDLLEGFMILIPNRRITFASLPVGSDSADDDEQFEVRGSVVHRDSGRSGQRTSVVIVVNLFLAAVLRAVLIKHGAWIGFTVHHRTRRPPGLPTSPSATLAFVPGSAPTTPSAAVRRE